MSEFSCCNCGGELIEREEPRNKFHPEYRTVFAECKAKCGVESIKIVLKEEPKPVE